MLSELMHPNAATASAISWLKAKHLSTLVPASKTSGMVNLTESSITMLPRDLNLSLQYLGGCIQAMLSDPRQLIQSDYSRVYLAKARLEQAKAMSLVQAQDDPFHNIQNTVRHNLENLDPSIAARRPLALLGPLLGIKSL